MEKFSYIGRPDGIGNRLEEIFKLECLCEQTNSQCEYIWVNRQAFRSYDFLFRADNVHLVAEQEPTYPVQDSLPKVVGTRSEYLKAARKIIPNFDISFATEVSPVGIHIRGTDRINDETEHPHFMRSYNELLLYMLNTVSLLNESRPEYVFIASESPALRNFFIDHLHESITVIDPVCAADVPEEYKDFFALTLCSEIWMVSKFSSFSIVASLLGDIPLNTFFTDGKVAQRYKAKFKYHKLCSDSEALKDDSDCGCNVQSSGIAPSMKLSLGLNTSMKSIGYTSVSLEGEPDIVDDAQELSKIPDESCERIIASHVLEHFDYSGRASQRVTKAIEILRVWHSKLVPGGMVYISVPDWEKLFAVMMNYKDNYWDIEDTPFIDPIGPIFGGMETAYNTHRMLFNFSCLKHCLEQADFTNVQPVENVALFTGFNGSARHWSSINVCAIK
ncbi:hypothetical protein [Desulfovibrio sp. JC010]|uniref:hypothetical protein n=1 Tax=Desulfovibrio sp. JC010 TaxID=2593641 RepID=UPI0013D50F1E|nr:hypothetical protein [Desulfovibrio sp. JC010]NDV26714.1 hypothetical protein [Desulfovibrio sp. JC010]